MLRFVYSLILLSFAIYSYSQIDLNLTLSANTFYQDIQQQLIYLGYFNRPLSAALYLILIFLLFIFYLLILQKTHKKQVTRRQIFWLIIISVTVLFFAYPAFSHDFFNYMFDARIVTTYHLNPYFYKALDFPADLWIRFMHWTHRTYPYGPIWLLVTLPFSFLGFGKFTVTLFNYKLMFTLFHLGNIYLIHKILDKVSPKFSLLGVVFYALNPLILIESLVSPHNEVIMLFFLFLAIYLLIKKKSAASVVALIISAGVKFVTLIYLPLFIYYFYFSCKSMKLLTLFKLMLLFILLPLVWEIIYREPYPWYFILLIGLGSLWINKKNIIILGSGISLGALARYAPYLYQGDYPAWVVHLEAAVFFGAIIFSLGLIGLGWLRMRFNKRVI